MEDKRQPLFRRFFLGRYFIPRPTVLLILSKNKIKCALFYCNDVASEKMRKDDDD